MRTRRSVRQQLGARSGSRQSVVMPAAANARSRSRIAPGPPNTNTSRSSSSGASSAAARLRSPARQASTIGSIASPQPSPRKNAS